VLEVRGASVGPGDGHQHGSGNPHYWLDPKNAEIITGTILEALGNLDPAHGREFEQNRRAFLQRIDSSLPAWEQRMAALQGRPLVGLSWRLGLFRPPLPARHRGLDRAQAWRAAEPRSPRRSHSPDAGRNIGIILRGPHEPERDGAFLAARTGAAMVTLAGSVGATPQATDYMALFDFNVDALTARASR